MFGGAGPENYALRGLYAAGERAFGAYDAILSDPKSDPYVISGVLSMLMTLKHDRRRFLDLTRRRVIDPNARVRLFAVQLLGGIGTADDTTSLAAFLSDENKFTVQGAARSIAELGGQRDLAALDVWLVAGRGRDNADLRKFVSDCRDRLAKKVERDGKPAK